MGLTPSIKNLIRWRRPDVEHYKAKGQHLKKPLTSAEILELLGVEVYWRTSVVLGAKWG